MSIQLTSGLTKLPETQETMVALGGLGNSMLGTSLGVLMSKDLSWEDHYDYMLSKAYKIFGLLCRSFAKAISIHTKKVLYISLVRSKPTYCSPIW